MTKSGTLFIVATPIGNPKDITLRALEVLQNADLILCEEYRRGTTLLKKLQITPKELLPLNEHNEIDVAMDLATRLIQGQNIALISDHGTPAFEDPGNILIARCVELGVRVIPIPGPSSLMAALSIADRQINQFLYAGFLSRDKKIRLKQLNKLKSYRLPVILMDTPYRLVDLLGAVEDVYGKKVYINLACNLTQGNETIYRDQISIVRKQLRSKKAEFILIIFPQIDSLI